MPFFKAAGALVYYAHVPKCGGSAIAEYLRARFGPLAFHDNRHLSQPEAARWTRSSPQHVDVAALERLIPASFFAAAFAVVRHPVARAVSIFHFQQEVERSIPAGMAFSDWLAGLGPSDPSDPFRHDNHLRPMTEIVPDWAAVFHLEHGLDALIPWFDALTGQADGPRGILPENTRGAHVKTQTPRAKPGPADLDRIARLYAADFARFGYDPASPQPKAAAPALPAGFEAARDRALQAMTTPLARLRRRIVRKLRG